MQCPKANAKRGSKNGKKSRKSGAPAPAAARKSKSKSRITKGSKGDANDKDEWACDAPITDSASQYVRADNELDEGVELD